MSSNERTDGWLIKFLSKALPWLVALVILMVTICFAWLLRRADERRLASTFDVNTTNLSAGIRDDLAFQEQSVVALSAWFQASEDATREEFDKFCELMASQVVHVQSFEWVPRVTQADRQRFEQTARDNGYREFTIKQWQLDGSWAENPQPWADEYFPVFFMHPMAGNEPALGIDKASNPGRWKAISRAKLTGQPTATERIELAQDTGTQSGFLIMVPVGDRGFATGAFRLRDLISSILAERSTEGLKLEIIDETTDDEQKRLLYQSPDYPAHVVDGKWQTVFRHEIGGRTWAMHWVYHPRHVAQELSTTPLMILICGTMFSGLSCLALVKNSRSRNKRIGLLEQLQSVHRGLLLNQQAIDSASDAVFFIREDASFIKVNRRACEFLGYSQNELLKMGVLDINPTQNEETWRQLWQKLLRDRTTSFEARHCRKDGSEYDCEIRVGLVVFDCEPIMVATVIDITKRRTIERALQLTQRTVDLSADAIFFIRADGSFQYANEQAANYLGYTRDELCQMSVSDINPAYPAEAWGEHLEETKRAGVLQLESQHMRKDGSVYDCELRKIYLEFEGEAIVVGLVRDITEVKRARRALEKSEDRFNWATVNANVGVWDWNVVTNQALFSATAKAQLGYTNDVDWGDFSDWEARLHPEDREIALQKIAMLIEKPHEKYVSEFRLKAISGNYVWIRSVGRGVFDQAGKLVRCVGVHIDITELKQRAAELRRTIQELEEFTYIASHDLKAPLRAIEQLTEWLAEDVADDLPKVSKGHLDLIRQRSVRMRKLLEDLLIYSRAGRTGETVSKINVDDLAKDMFELSNVPHTFNFEVDFEVLELVGRRTPLETVFRNLIANSVKHHDRDSGNIRVTNRVDGDFAVFTVSDDGPGIDPKYHDRVVQMFQTLRPRDEIEGSGLGLALVKKLVEGEGGEISLDAANPRGLKVTFTWPITALKSDELRGRTFAR